MTVEELFAQSKLNGFDLRLMVHIFQEPVHKGGGWRVDVGGTCAYGDTLADATQAGFDHYNKKRSRRARLCPPYFSSAPRTLANARRVSYDYRVLDWHPDQDPEPVRGQSEQDQRAWWEAQTKLPTGKLRQERQKATKGRAR